MRLNEHWLWLGPQVALAEAGVTVFRAHPGAWWLARGDDMAGVFHDDSVLRAVRVACTPTIDGCERGPHKFGFEELGPRRPLQRGPKWLPVTEAELPASATRYDRSALEPVQGCCTTSDAVPELEECTTSGWERYIDESATRAGRLAKTWNAHPKGSVVFVHGDTLEAGFTVVDEPAGVG